MLRLIRSLALVAFALVCVLVPALPPVGSQGGSKDKEDPLIAAMWGSIQGGGLGLRPGNPGRRLERQRPELPGGRPRRERAA
jgi:hypothetical protein